MPELANVTWTRDLARLVENRSSKRTAVQANTGQAWRLTGVDGFSRAGIRPMAGFKKLPEGLGLTSGQTLQRGDFWVVTLPVDSDTAFTGYVYRYRDGGSGPYVVKFKWYDGSTDTAGVGWNTSAAIFSTTPKEPMDIAVVGRVLYVFVRGQEPAALYFNANETLTIVNDTGPGPNPPSFKIGALNNVSYLQTGTCLNNVDNATAALNQVSQGRIIVNREIDGKGDNYPAFKGPVASGSNKPTGETPLMYAPGSYSFAFELVDSRTNRKSQLSEIIELEPEDFEGAVTVSTSTTYNVGRRSYILFELLIDRRKYDQCYLYRSVRNPPNTTAGPLQSALFLEAVLVSTNNDYSSTDLDSKTFGSANSPPTFERWMFYCVLDDQALLVQDPYSNRVVVDTDMPKGGAAIAYEGIMVVSDIGGTASDPAPNQSNVGEIRYSSTLAFSPESFPPNNRNVPPTLRDTPIAWVQAAGNALGLSRSRAYFTRASGGFIEFEPIANGFGLESRRGLASIAELVFYVSSTGIKLINASGRLDAMAAFDNVIQDDWANTLADVFMVYDPDAKLLWTINPDKREALMVWMETNTPSSAVDIPFVAASPGLIPTASDGVEIAQFATASGNIYVYDRKRTKTDGSGNRRTALLDWSGAGVAVISSVGSPTANVYPITITGATLPTDGSLTDAYVYVSTGARRGEKYRITIVNTGTTFGAISDPKADGTFLNPTTLIGESIEISPIFVRWVDAPIDLQSPDGYQFGPSDRFRSRSCATLKTYFSDSLGLPVGTTRATYSSTLWRGNLTDLYTWGQPRNDDGDIVAAVADHNPAFASLFQHASDAPVTGTVLSAGLDIFVTDLDFLAVAATISGTILHTTRTRGP